QKAVGLKRHLDQNSKDLHNKRSLQITESKIRRLVKYYKKEGVLPEDWIYNLQTAEMLISR
ncbi:MAG: 30S ribosomal protein S15, partial [Methanocellales archaeon]|nr:30S ribosomal protein S15 [Methanocellales archaeon]